MLSGLIQCFSVTTQVSFATLTAPAAAFITSTESSYRNVKKKILALVCFQESFSSLQSFQQQSVV